MKIKLYSICLFFVMLISTVFGLSVYDNAGKYTYYVNNANPQIYINITSPSQVINVSHANITIINNLNKSSKLIKVDYLLNPGETKLLNFSITQNLTYLDNTYFELYTCSSEMNKVISEGDPTNFYIKYDNVSPILLSPDSSKEIYLTYLDINKSQSFEFDEKISSYSIFLNNEPIAIQNFFSVYENYPTSIILNSNSNSNKLIEGLNNLTIVVVDLAGNSQNYSFKVFYLGKNIEVSLLTKENDSTLKYYYNSNYPNLFNKTIYSSEEKYTLKIATSKPAICYYSQSLNTFNSMNNIPSSDLIIFTSQNNESKIHTIDVDAKPYSLNLFKKIWVVCVNKNINSDIAYLANSIGMSNSLITLKVYSGSSLDVVDYSPKTEITSNNFSVTATTNNFAYCNFKLDFNNFVLMSTQNYLVQSNSHVFANNGNHTLQFSCFDLLNNNITKSYNLNVDNTKGVKIIDYSPKFSGISPTNVRLTLSEDVPCRYSSIKSDSPEQFINLTNLSGSGYNRNFVATFTNKSNTYYIYCQKGTIVENIISIGYDSSSPIISNLSFVNNGIKSNYLGDDKKIEIEFDLLSSLPISNYYVKVFFQNSSNNINKVFSSNDISISGNFKNATKISIVAQNEIGKNSSTLEKTIMFDFEDPSITFLNNNGIINIVCYDVGSGCNKISYGISSTPIDCKTKTRYNLNSTLNVQKNNYLCAEVFDKVGHRGYKQELILFSSYNNIDLSNSSNGKNKINTSNPLTVGNKNSSKNNISSNSNTDEENIIIDSITPEEDEEEAWVSNNYDNATSTDGINYGLIVAIFLILVVSSGGGYYAYKKGYLNKELEKLGIKKPQIKNLDGTLVSGNNSLRNANTSDSISKDGLTKSKYNDHLDKLNSFVENTIQKRKDVFDKFSNKTVETKSTEKNLNLKNKKSLGTEMTAEDYDEFYDSNEISTMKKQDPNYKRDAENFEDYYQKKKKLASEKNKK